MTVNSVACGRLVDFKEFLFNLGVYEKAFKTFKFNMIFFGVFVAVFLIFLSTTTMLATLGYPFSTFAVSTPEQVLEYMQNNNRSIMRIAFIFHLFLLTLTMFLTHLYQFAKVLIAEKATENK